MTIFLGKLKCKSILRSFETQLVRVEEQGSQKLKGLENNFENKLLQTNENCHTKFCNFEVEMKERFKKIVEDFETIEQRAKEGFANVQADLMNLKTTTVHRCELEAEKRAAEIGPEIFSYYNSTVCKYS